MDDIDYKLFYDNIKFHIDMMVTDEMRKHAYCSTEHDLDFQIFRLLSGYELALDELAIEKLKDRKI